MKYSIILIFALLISTSIFSNEKQKEYALHASFIPTDLKQNTSFNESLKKTYKKEFVTLCGKLSIISSSNSNFKFMAMHCSWTDFVLVDNENLFLKANICDKNFPKPINLMVGEKNEFPAEIQIPKEYYEASLQNFEKNNSYFTFKIGYKIIDEKDFNYQNITEHFKNDSLLTDIIWTDSIEIRDYGK